MDRLPRPDAIAFAGTAGADGGLYVAASTVYRGGPPTITLSRLDSNGTVTASHSLGTGVAYDALADAEGVVLVGDASDPTARGFAAAIAIDGTERWRLSFDPEVRGLARTAGGYALVGDGPLLARLDA